MYNAHQPIMFTVCIFIASLAIPTPAAARVFRIALDRVDVEVASRRENKGITYEIRLVNNNDTTIMIPSNASVDVFQDATYINVGERMLDYIQMNRLGHVFSPTEVKSHDTAKWTARLSSRKKTSKVVVNIDFITLADFSRLKTFANSEHKLITSDEYYKYCRYVYLMVPVSLE